MKAKKIFRLYIEINHWYHTSQNCPCLIQTIRDHLSSCFQILAIFHGPILKPVSEPTLELIFFFQDPIFKTIWTESDRALLHESLDTLSDYCDYYHLNIFFRYISAFKSRFQEKFSRKYPSKRSHPRFKIHFQWTHQILS
jgi:hypothetical protein